MSRGFVKEDDLELAGTDLPERPVSEHPNYVTPAGLKLLQDQATKLENEHRSLSENTEDPVAQQRLAILERDLRYIETRIGSAIVVDPTTQNKDTAFFGARVEVEDDNGETHQFIIVGEDEADAAENKVSYISPIAKALIGKKVGDSAVWQRPAGNLTLTITKISI